MQKEFFNSFNMFSRISCYEYKEHNISYIQQHIFYSISEIIFSQNNVIFFMDGMDMGLLLENAAIKSFHSINAFYIDKHIIMKLRSLLWICKQKDIQLI